MAQLRRGDATSSGLSLRAARWIMVLVWGTGVLHGALLGEFSASGPWGVAAYASALVAAILLTLARPGPLPTPIGWIMVGCAAVATLVVLVQYSGPDTVWLLKFSSYVVALSIPRGNPVIGGIGGLVLVGLGVSWAIDVRTDASDVVSMLVNPVMAPIAGFIWLFVTRRFVNREQHAHRAAAEAEARQRVAGHVLQGIRAELAEIRDVVREPLARIVAGAVIDDQERTRVSIAEARVRDGIRAPQLRNPELDAAIAEASGRGVEVVVLGEPDRNRRLGSDTAAALVALVTDPSAERITLRSLPPGRAGDVSVVVEGGSTSWSEVLPRA